MKDANLGEYLLWMGKPAKIIGETSGRQVIIEMLENCKCPHCNGDLGKEQNHVIVSSPLFQQNAEQLKTIKVDNVSHIPEGGNFGTQNFELTMNKHRSTDFISALIFFFWVYVVIVSVFF